MDKELEEFLKYEAITLRKYDAIKKMIRKFKLDEDEAKKLYTKWRNAWCHVTEKQ